MSSGFNLSLDVTQHPEVPEPDWADKIAKDAFWSENSLDAIAAALRAERAASDPKLTDMRFANGVLDMSLIGPAFERMATLIGGWFANSPAMNFAEIRLHDRHETDEIYILTVQKKSGLTPAEKLKIAEEKHIVDLRKSEANGMREAAKMAEEVSGTTEAKWLIAERIRAAADKIEKGEA